VLSNERDSFGRFAQLLNGKCCPQTWCFGAGNRECSALGKRNGLRPLCGDDYQSGANFDAVGEIIGIGQCEGATLQDYNSVLTKYGLFDRQTRTRQICGSSIARRTEDNATS